MEGPPDALSYGEDGEDEDDDLGDLDAEWLPLDMYAAVTESPRPSHLLNNGGFGSLYSPAAAAAAAHHQADQAHAAALIMATRQQLDARHPSRHSGGGGGGGGGDHGGADGYATASSSESDDDHGGADDESEDGGSDDESDEDHARTPIPHLPPAELGLEHCGRSAARARSDSSTRSGNGGAARRYQYGSDDGSPSPLAAGGVSGGEASRSGDDGDDGDGSDDDGIGVTGDVNSGRDVRDDDAWTHSPVVPDDADATSGTWTSLRESKSKWGFSGAPGLVPWSNGI